MQAPEGKRNGQYESDPNQQTRVSGFERYVDMPVIRHWLLGQFGDCEELSQAELQQCLGVDSATITRQVKGLEIDGLLLRRPDPKDNRYTLVSLTEKGKEIVNELQQKRSTYEAHLVAGLSEEHIAIFEHCLHLIEAHACEIINPIKRG